MADFKINYTPQPRQKIYHSYGSGKFQPFMPFFYNGFPMDEKEKMEAPYEERLERLKRGEILNVERYILELDNLVNEVGFGGSRGGGKSYADAGEGAMDANIFPGVKIGIFRRTLGALNESITEKLLEMLPKELKNDQNGWKYNKKDNSIDFLHNDSKIKLCYCENYNDALKYRGFEFDILIIDEEADLDDKTINFLKGTLRTAKFIKYADGTPVYYPKGHKKYLDKDGQRVVVNYPTIYFFSCNPEGPGFIRVRDEFVRPTKYGKIIVDKVETLKSGKTTIRRRAFVQANMSDNKYLNDDYELQFSGMTEAEIAKNVDGNWEISDSNFFRHFDFNAHVLEDLNELYEDSQLASIDTGDEFPSYWKSYGGLDWGYYPDYAALSVYFIGDGNVVKRYEFKWHSKTITEAAEHILELQRKYNFKLKMLAIPHDMAKQGEKYFNSKNEFLGETKEKVLNRYGIHTLVTRSSREDGWEKVHDLMYFKKPDGKPIWRIHKSCVMSISQFQTLSRDEHKTEDITDGQEDHFADSDRYFAVMYNRFISHTKRLQEKKSFRDRVIENELKTRTRYVQHDIAHQ